MHIGDKAINFISQGLSQIKETSKTFINNVKSSFTSDKTSTKNEIEKQKNLGSEAKVKQENAPKDINEFWKQSIKEKNQEIEERNKSLPGMSSKEVKEHLKAYKAEVKNAKNAEKAEIKAEKERINKRDRELQGMADAHKIYKAVSDDQKTREGKEIKNPYHEATGGQQTDPNVWNEFMKDQKRKGSE